VCFKKKDWPSEKKIKTTQKRKANNKENKNRKYLQGVLG
jgi:hypothetical protein